ncbi:MAG: 4Fe-4S dicluster domain-containing protein [Halanaerobiaceae bacterium]
MSVEIDKNLCHGCREAEEPVCVRYCPGDLLKIDERGKAELRNREDCWDCMVCVKLCPARALKTRLPYQLASHNASLVPELHSHKIIWRLKNMEEEKEVFELKTRHA